MEIQHRDWKVKFFKTTKCISVESFNTVFRMIFISAYYIKEFLISFDKVKQSSADAKQYQTFAVEKTKNGSKNLFIRKSNKDSRYGSPNIFLFRKKGSKFKNFRNCI